MATTDARPGFKLPWSADRNESDSSDDTAPNGRPDEDTASATSADAVEAVEAAPSVDPWGFGRTREAEQVPVDVDATTTDGAAADPPGEAGPWGTPAAPVEPAPAPRRKPNKLMADLTRAMQTAAEGARDETLARLQTDAKAFIEEIHARSGTEAAELRSRADEDVAAIRDWSKAEIARIREETERRISERKSGLEGEIEAHAARIEHRIERIQVHVAQFETEMAAFFEKLLAEDDPTHLAAMAENLPEPPSFEDDFADDGPLPEARVTDAAAQETADEAVAEPTETADDPGPDAESAFAAIQAAAEAAEASEHAFGIETPTHEIDQSGAVEAEAETADRSPEAETDVVAGAETMTEPDPDAGDPDEDPRVATLGLSPEAAAEAEAEAEVDATDDRDEIATFSDDALAARLAGLVPDGEVAAPRADTHTTRVVVTGLISVASIAGFKRQLGRIQGVASVGVSSGPDGEFVFAVTHAPDVSLAESLPTLSEFGAEVTDTGDDTISVSARDPETAA